jgi:tetratricopeptide (TPR) repeat protein
MPKQHFAELFERGLDALNRAEFPSAIELLGEVAAEDPSNALALRSLGVCYLETRRPDLALEALERALAADASDADTHYVLGNACGTLGQLERAAASYRRALELAPDHAKAEEFLIRTESLLSSREHYRRGMKLLYDAAEPSLADLNEALRQLVNSVALFQDSPALETLRDCTLKLLAHRRDVGIEIAPSAELAAWGRACERGYHCALAGNWVGARAAYEDALGFRSHDAFVHHALGFSLVLLHEPLEAVRAWLRVLQLDPAYDFAGFGRVRSAT